MTKNRRKDVSVPLKKHLEYQVKVQGKIATLRDRHTEARFADHNVAHDTLHELNEVAIDRASQALQAEIKSLGQKVEENTAAIAEHRNVALTRTEFDREHGPLIDRIAAIERHEAHDSGIDIGRAAVIAGIVIIITLGISLLGLLLDHFFTGVSV